MVSKEGGKCMLTNSESDSETTAAAPSASLALEAVKCSLDAGRQVRKRNKALQVRFKDICEAQNEQQREAALLRGGRPAAYRAAYRKYMTVPARRSIPNVTRSTGVQTSPDPKKRYQTFPFERSKKAHHTFKHVASVESYNKGQQNNGFVVDVKPPPSSSSSNKAAVVGGLGLDEEEDEEEEDLGAGGGACGGRGARSVRRTRALLHTNECGADAALQLSCSALDATADCLPDAAAVAAVGMEADYQLCSVPPKPRTGLQQQQQQHREGVAAAAAAAERSAKRQLLMASNPGEVGSSSSLLTRTLPDRASSRQQLLVSPIAWNSLTQVECLESPSVRSKRKKGSGGGPPLQLNGLQSSSSQTLPRAAGGCVTKAQCHAGQLSARPLRAMEEPAPAAAPPSCGGSREARRPAAAGATADPGPGGEACKQIVPVSQEGDVKAQLQAMETLISSSQETIKVLLGVIQELEKGEAHREGLSYRTGQDTANCDTCRNSACIIYSVELDFKQQEDKLQPLMKRLCPTDDAYFSPLAYPSSGGEAFTSTPKRKSKAESKKHGRWKLWFL